MNQVLKEGVDFYMSEEKMVFTARWLSERGYCCGNGCRHCPYDYESVAQPLRTQLRIKRMAGSENNLENPSSSPAEPSTPGASS